MKGTTATLSFVILFCESLIEPAITRGTQVELLAKVLSEERPKNRSKMSPGRTHLGNLPAALRLRILQMTNRQLANDKPATCNDKPVTLNVVYLADTMGMRVKLSFSRSVVTVDLRKTRFPI